MNNFVGVGRLVKDVELREVNNSKVANFSIAITRQYKNSNGEYETDFINCRSWGQVGEKIKEYCNKGDMIGVKGSIRNDVYQDKDGNKKSSIYVNVERVTFLSSKKTNNGLPEETEVPF